MWGAEVAIEAITETFFALILAWMLYGGSHKYIIPLLALLPLIMDSDHLLITYSDGIKAFHSLFFIYAVAGSMLLYGYAHRHREAELAGITAFSVLIMGISLDLLEGGKITFMYPLSSQAYALPYFGAYGSSKMALISLVLLVLVLAYEYGSYITKERSYHSRRARLSLRTEIYRAERLMHMPGIGSESVLRVSALLASFIVSISR